MENMSIYRLNPMKAGIITLVTMVTVILLNENFKATPRVHQPITKENGGPVHQSHEPFLSRDHPSTNHHGLKRFKGMYVFGHLNMFIYGAFLDDRIQPNLIRIFGMQKTQINVTDFVCMGESQSGEFQPGYDAMWEVPGSWQYIDKSWPNWSPYFGIQIECPLRTNISLPENFKITLTMANRRDIKVTIPLETAHKPRTKKTMAVLVKPMTGKFSVARMVEWFEIHRLINVTDILLYNTDLNGLSRFVVDYYEDLGLAHVINFPYLYAVIQRVEDLGGLTPEQRYGVYQQAYLVALQDALYRFHGTYRYLLVIDLDEVVLPTVSGESLPATLERVHEDNPHGSGFIFPTAWHFEENGPLADTGIPDYLYMQKYARACTPIDRQPKSALMTSRVRTLNFHQALTSVDKAHSVEVLVNYQRYAYVHHFRGLCSEKLDPEICQELVGNSALDPVVPRYNLQLTQRVRNVLNHLQIS